MKEIPEIILRPISELKPYPNNPRINDHAVSAVAASIKQFGFRFPILLDKDDVIIAGHTRIKAAQSIGMYEVPTMRAPDLSTDQVRALRLLDNKVSEKADWDMDLLREEIAAIEMDLSLFDVDFGITDPMGAETSPGNATLSERFLVPPFTVLDARQGYWQARKASWLALGIQSEIGRTGSPGKSPRPATKLVNGKTQRGDGKGRPI